MFKREKFLNEQLFIFFHFAAYNSNNKNNNKID